MNKRTALSFCGLFVFLAVAVSCTGGFNGPGSGTTVRRGEAVTVSQLSTLVKDSRVKLTGNITQSLGREYYTFRDSTGEITVEIERSKWWGKSVEPSDTVEITATVERKRDGRVQAEVKKIRKL